METFSQRSDEAASVTTFTLKPSTKGTLKVTPSVSRTTELVTWLHLWSLRPSRASSRCPRSEAGGLASPLRDTALVADLSLNHAGEGVTLATSLPPSTTYDKPVLTLVLNCSNRTALTSTAGHRDRKGNERKKDFSGTGPAFELLYKCQIICMSCCG